jgi:nitrite reductase/ring-hydroxylating ferredoxin subunit
MLYLCRTGDVAAGEILRVDPPDHAPLAVYNIAGEFYATDDTCSHGEASLAEGEIDGDMVECPFHAGCFEIATGLPAGAPCTIAIRSYELVIEDGAIYSKGEKSP